jgi:uncharacterized membrane protein
MESTPPLWVITLSYWLHMLATVAWIGGLAAVALLILPAAQRTLASELYTQFLNRVQKRLENIAWFSISLLVVTGLIQMTANPHYQGFLVITNRWAVAILLKHLVFLLMVALSAYLTWVIGPQIGRAALLQAHGLPAEGLPRLRSQQLWLLRADLGIGFVILALTALARAS